MEFRLSDRHIVALNFLLVAILAYFAALSANDFVSMRIASSGPVIVRDAAIALQSAPNHSRAEYQAIVSRDIFNLAPPPAVQSQPQPVVAADLHLTLIGVSLSGRKSFAIIEDRTGEQSVYRSGSMIPDAGKLIEVQNDRVIIDRNGTRVALELPKDNMPGPVMGMRPIPVQPAIDSPDDSDSSSADSYDPNVTDLGNNHYQIPRDTVAHSLSHMSELFTEIRAIPNIQNGRTNGFSLSEIEAGSLFDEMGLEEGDVLKTVNGQAVTNPAQAMQLLNLLQNQNTVNLQVVRDGHPVMLNYQIQ